MKQWFQSGRWLLALLFSAGIALQCSAQDSRPNRTQNRQENRPPKQQGQQQNQPRRQEQRQPRQEARRVQPERRIAEAPRNSATVNPPRRSGDSREGGNRPPSASGESVRRPNFNGNRPPNASGGSRDFTLEERQRLQRDEKRFKQLPPQQQQELRDRAQVWQRMTPPQRDHVRNEVLPKWQQMPPDRRRAIQQRLGVLKNMPESARNQHLNDPNFTRGMSQEDQATLRDLSHLHVGGSPDPPNE
jgi:hypothetical protein